MVKCTVVLKSVMRVQILVFPPQLGEGGAGAALGPNLVAALVVHGPGAPLAGATTTWGLRNRSAVPMLILTPSKGGKGA